MEAVIIVQSTWVTSAQMDLEVVGVELVAQIPVGSGVSGCAL